MNPPSAAARSARRAVAAAAAALPRRRPRTSRPFPGASPWPGAGSASAAGGGEVAVAVRFRSDGGVVVVPSPAAGGRDLRGGESSPVASRAGGRSRPAPGDAERGRAVVAGRRRARRPPPTASAPASARRESSSAAASASAGGGEDRRRSDDDDDDGGVSGDDSVRRTGAKASAAAATDAPGFDDGDGGAPRLLALGPRTTYRLLGLESFADAEIDGVFDAAVAPSRKAGGGSAESGGGEGAAAAAEEEEEGGPWLDHPRLASYLLGRVRSSDLDDVRRHDPRLGADETDRRRRRYASAAAAAVLEKFRSVAAVRCDRRGTITDEEDEILGSPSTRLVVRKRRFRRRVKELASEVDAGKAVPIGLSMLMIGSSVGVVTPVMPFVVESLGLTPGQYGAVISAFALAKIAGNVPSAVLVERHGRRPYLTYSLCLVSAGVAGIGLSSSWEHLFACRLLTGAGVAALSTAATLTMADISTPLNRASTMAPIMSAFSAGMAFGPAVGGMLADRLGVSETFYAVGASYLGLTLVNRALLVETKARPLRFPWHRPNDSGRNDAAGVGGRADGREEEASVADAARAALAQWSPLLSDPRIRHAVLMNGFYWTSLAGSQMTLLPLLLTDPGGMALSATAVGQTYMGMSLVQVVGVPLMARFVDRAGKPVSIVAGCALIGGSMVALPYCQTLPETAAALGTWALGSSVLSTAPVSYVSDVAGEERRAQALALLRTTGDVGFLVGAGGIGMAADWTGDLGTAMHCSAGVLVGATAWFATRRVLAAGREGAGGKAKGGR